MLYYPEKITTASKKDSFLEFLKVVWKEDSQQFSLLETTIEQQFILLEISIDWKDFAEAISTIIKNSLNCLEPITPDLDTPDSGLKGLYFCLGDNALSLDIAGSLYYNEMDWAGNADYYADTGNACCIMDALVTAIKDTGIALTASEYITLLFVSYIILKNLPGFYPNPLIKNAGVAIGFCDGDELILGYFQDGSFIMDIKLVENGEYENPASFTMEIPHYEPRGPLWDYLRWNFSSFLRNHNLYDDFISLGEKEAEKISQMYPDELCISRCPKCNFIRKTPRASLCLNCGNFQEESRNFSKW